MWSLVRRKERVSAPLIAVVLMAIALALDVPDAAAGLNPPLADNIQPNVSLVLDSHGHPVISFVAYGSSHGLKLAHCSNPTCTGNLSIQMVDNAGAVSNPSLALDGNGNPVISYVALGSNPQYPMYDLRLAHCNDPNCAGRNESIVTVEVNAATTASLALDDSDNPVIAYENAALSALSVVRCGDPNCVSHQDQPLVSLEPLRHLTDIELVLDAQDIPVIAYASSIVLEAPDELKLLRCNDPNCAGATGSLQEVDTAGSALSLVLDSIGNPVIGHDGDTGLRLVHCNDANCAGANESIEDVAPYGYWPSVALDLHGNPVIAYAYAAQDRGLAVMHCNDPNCAGADESVRTLARDSSGKSAKDPQLALDGHGTPTTSFAWGNATNALYVDAPYLNTLGGGTGSGTMTANGIACSTDAGVTSGDCSEVSDGTTSVSVVAAPNAGSMFTQWQGCDALSTTNAASPGDTCTVSAGNRSITASFRRAPTEMHVEFLEPDAWIFENGAWVAIATVYVFGNDHYPVGGVTVTGKWLLSGSVVRCVTNYDGSCWVTRAGGSRSKWTYTVTNVTGQGLPYNPAANHVTSVDVCSVEGGVCE